MNDDNQDEHDDNPEVLEAVVYVRNGPTMTRHNAVLVDALDITNDTDTFHVWRLTLITKDAGKFVRTARQDT